VSQDAAPVADRVRQRGRFSRDVWWNVGALGVAGALGILLNFLISVVYGAETLGVFNQVFAVYLLLAQLGALGFHYSVLTHVAAAEGAAERQAIMTSALLATIVSGAVFAGAAWLLAEPIGRLLGSAGVARGLEYAAPGILFFALSKVTLACANALGRMRWYAVLFAGRFVLLVLAFLGCAVLNVGAAELPVILTVTEGVTFLVSLVPVAPQLRWIGRSVFWRRVREHARFAVKGFTSGMLSELNTRVDVLILGYFARDAVVGAYSFAAILAEGLYQLLIVLRTNYAPLVIRLWAEGRRADLVQMVRRARNRTYLGAIGLGIMAAAGYWLAVPWLTSDPEIAASGPYFAVLIAGMVASAGYAPFQPLLLYAGFPGWHTVLMVGIIAINAIGNLLLIPVLGPIGAALATAIAFVLCVFTLRAMVAQRLAIRI
jgi:O-antigen/teichoic acid export membrane protein